MFNLRNTSFLLFVTILNVINFVDRQFIASFANFIIPDLQLTNTEFGLLTGVIFIFFYVVSGLFVGTLADRYNRTKIIGVGVIVWSFLQHIRFGKELYNTCHTQTFYWNWGIRNDTYNHVHTCR